MTTTLSTREAELLAQSWQLALSAERKSEQTLKTYGDGVRQHLAWCPETDAPPLVRASLNLLTATLLDNGARGLRHRRGSIVRRDPRDPAAAGDFPNGPRDLPRQSLAAAESDLARVREALESATRAGGSSGELKEVVQGYLDEHGPTLRAAASAIGEEARRQTLQELYKWRAQLAAQLEEQQRRTQRQEGDQGRE